MDIDAIMSQAQLNAKGWKMTEHTDGVKAIDCIHLYVYDHNRQKVELLSIGEEHFYSLAKRSSFDSSEVVQEALKGLEKFFKGKRSNAFLGQLGTTLALYMIGSQAWGQTRVKVHHLSDKKPHMFVVLYNSHRNIHKRLIRPFFGIDEQRLLPLEDVLDSVKSCIVMDQQNHPEWKL